MIKIIKILFLFLFISVYAKFEYIGPTIIDIPISSFKYNPINKNILVASDNHIFSYGFDGELINIINSGPNIKIYDIDINVRNGMVAAFCYDNLTQNRDIRFYKNSILVNRIDVTQTNYDIKIYDVYFDNLDLIISINATLAWDHDLHYYLSSLIFFNYDGKIKEVYNIGFGIIRDLIVNNKQERIVFSNFRLNSPMIQIYILDVNGTSTVINITKMYGPGGLCVDNDGNIIVGEYGLDIYSKDGIFIKHLDPSNDHMIYSPQVYDGSIAYLDLFNDNYKPFIQFVDYDGNKILKVQYTEHQIYTANASFQFDEHGNIICNINNQLKIWKRVNT